jgi:hypothetical protein
LLYIDTAADVAVVWNNAGCATPTGILAEDAETAEEVELGLVAASAMDAVAIDKRDLTRSNGYVEPIGMAIWIVKHGINGGQGRHVQTDVIPAKAPLANRFGVSSSFVPCKVNAFII